MRITRFQPRREKGAVTELRVFLCSDCGLYQLVRRNISTRQTAA
jgi:hypothetical protein